VLKSNVAVMFIPNVAQHLPARDETVFYLSALLHAERQRRGTRKKRRALTCFKQSVLILRWLLDGTRMKQLARDNTISQSTGYTYLHEAITVLAAQAPGLHSALLAAKAAGYDYVLLDGTLIETDRIATPGPTPACWTPSQTSAWTYAPWRTWATKARPAPSPSLQDPAQGAAHRRPAAVQSRPQPAARGRGTR